MKNKIEKTNAIRLVQQKKLDFVVHDYSDTTAVSGLEVADALGEDPKKVFKTLVTIGKSNTNYVFCIPVTHELDLKKAAKAVNEKNIEMIKSKDLLGLTGYIHGGCSPIGMKKSFMTVIDSSAEALDRICISGGKIGLQIELNVKDLDKVIRFKFDDITM